MRRFAVLVVVLLGGMIMASILPGVSQRIRSVMLLPGSGAPASNDREATTEERKPASANDQAGTIKLSDDEIKAAGIELAIAQEGAVVHRIIVPGTIVPHADRIAHVAVRLPGTVAELRKKVGDPVDRDEVLAIFESREVADAKSEYLAARLTNDLQQELFERDKALWDKRISTEQQFLRSRKEAANAKMRYDISRQKLFALGLTQPEIAGLPEEPEAYLRRQEVRSPIAGHVVERKVELGMVIGRDNLETELFVIADLDVVWVELAVSPADLPLIREGQAVTLASRVISEDIDGKVVFISPMLDKDTRAARVVAEIDNRSGVWRPGSFVTAAIAFDQQSFPLVVPANAIQTMGGASVAFVRSSDGFQKRIVTLGQSDDRFVEVVAGLKPGESVAATNTFVLKAELLKALAED